MKKLITLLLIAALSASSITALAAQIPKECAPYGTDEAAIAVTENLISPILDNVANGEGYGSASVRANTAIQEAHTKIYQAADPSYNPAVDRVSDFCYWDIPTVDSATTGQANY